LDQEKSGNPATIWSTTAFIINQNNEVTEQKLPHKKKEDEPGNTSKYRLKIKKEVTK
jgi:hypothetical protein